MEKVRFGIIGTGFVTERVIAAARCCPGFELTALYSRTQERADFFASLHGIPHTFTSLEEMLMCPQVDAVYIASPNCMHAQQAIQSMEHGKHVLCEKPLASNAREVREMIRTAERCQVTLMEAMITTMSPNFKALKEHLPRLGKVRNYFSSYCQYSSRYDKFKEGIVLNAFRPELSNGAVMDIGIYTIYPMVALFGRPESVQASGLLLPSGADGQGAALFGYRDMGASVMYSKISDSFLPTEIQGEGGTMTIRRINDFRSLTFQPHQAPSSGLEKVATVEDIGRPMEMDSYYHEMVEFLSLVRSGRLQSVDNSWEHSLATIECIDEIRRQIGVTFPAD